VTSTSNKDGITDDMRANLRRVDVIFNVEEFKPPQGVEGPVLGKVDARFAFKNIGRSSIGPKAIISMGVFVSKPLNEDEENILFRTGWGKHGLFTQNNEISSGEAVVLDWSMRHVINPDDWALMKDGKEYIY